MTTSNRCRLLLTLAILLCADFAFAQQTQNNSGFISSTQCVVVSAGGLNTGGYGVTGTWTGTLTAYGVVGQGTAAPLGSATTNGSYTVSIAGYTLFEVCGNTVGSGAAFVQVTASSAGSASSGGGCIATVSTLSSSCGTKSGTLASVTDGSTTSDCTVGGGSNKNACIYNGSAWAFAGNAGSNPTFAQVGTGTNVSATDTVGSGGTLNVASGAVIDFSLIGTGTFKIPQSAGCTSSVTKNICLDTTANLLHVYQNSADSTFGTGAFAAAYSLPAATNSVLGGVKPDGTSILNTSGAISVTPTSIGLGNVTNNAQLPIAGGTMTGKLVTLTPTTGTAGLNLPPGTAPTSPVNGDCWTTSLGLYCQIAGATVGPFGTGSGGISGLTTGLIPKAGSATSIVNSSCDDGITTANTFTCSDPNGIAASAGPITAAAPPGKAGMFALVGNTANQTIPTNYFAWGGFSSASATAYGLQPPNTAPSGGQLMSFPTPTSGWSQATWVTPGTGSVTSIGTTSPITGGTITTTGTIACATCVVASSPGVGLAHFAGSTQTVTSSGLAIADMTATGTPNSTTYLRGDNTWSTPSGGGGGVTVTDETASFNTTFSGTTENWYAVTSAASGVVLAALPNTVASSGQCIDISNASSYTVTAFPGTTGANGSNIGTLTVGGLVALLLRAGQGARICSDGTNYNVTSLANNLALGGTWRSARAQPNNFTTSTFAGDGIEIQFASSGTGPTMTLIAPTSSEPPYIDIASPATLNVSFGYNNALNGGWVFGRNTVVRERVQLTTTTNQRVWAAAESSSAGTGGIGTSDTPSASTLFADGIAFRYSTSAADTNWMACTFKNNVGTNCVSTGVAIATTGVTLMWQDLSNLPTPGVAFYVNGKLTNFLTTDYPTTGGNEENILYDTALTAAVNHIRWGGRYVESDQ